MKIDGQIPQNIEPFNEDTGQTNTVHSSNDSLTGDAIETFQNAQFGDGSVDITDQQNQLDALKNEKKQEEIANKQRQLAQQQGLEMANAQEAKAAQDDSGFKATDLIPFGIGNWFDGEGTFASDLGKTILSIACPIPFVGGLLANWGGDWLGNAIVNTADWVGSTISDAASWTEGAVKDAGEAIGDAASAVGGAVSDGAGAVADAAGDVADAVGDAANAVGGAVSDALDW